MRRLILAWNFLTSLPPRTDRFTPQDLSRSMIFFPLIGLVIGFFPAAVIFISHRFVSPFLGSLTAVFILTIVTGGLHLDGLADTIDGLAGGKNKKEILSIMREANIGSMGVIALIFIIAFKAALLSEIWKFGIVINILKAILFFPVLGRWSMVAAAWLMPYARDENGIGEAFAKGVTVREWLLSTFCALIIGVFMFGVPAVLLLLLVFLTTLVFIKYFNRKIGGVTGDVFGAINELIEVFSLGYLFLFFRLPLTAYGL